MNKLLTVLVLIGLLLFDFSADLQASGRSESENNLVSVTIAVLPVVDSLPLYIAEKEGLFLNNKIDIKIVSVANPDERNRLMQSGEIDGMLNELSTLALFNRDQVLLNAVLISRKPVEGSPLFRIVASPGSGISSVKDLEGVPIAVSENTIIEYLTERILVSAGMDLSSVLTKNVPVIPERYQLLMNGVVKAAMLPDPLGASALSAGAIPIIDDLAFPDFSMSILSFNADLINSNKRVVRGFVNAWNEAVLVLNSYPEKYRSLLVDKVGLPEKIENSFIIPRFPVKEVPDENQWNDVILWLHEKKMLDSYPSYETSIINLFDIPGE